MPLKLDTKALVAFKPLRISSNVGQNSQETLLILTVEDLYLFLPNYKLTNYDLRRDYICIDSCFCLIELLSYIGEDGDINASKGNIVIKKLASDEDHHPASLLLSDKNEETTIFSTSPYYFDIKITLKLY